ncbi:hypothetical protein ACFOUP_14115 [Belliella kenyensis]|uniref:Membrane or secreted protein n=1 Tax=Belliella kenyensis TaxID=1472724 RepID=A0ABV8EMJ1_9BACT|nr:hypothetical protein [Belliella kenyensis]MCH7401579.1 hypothetical protein [Belliella kenyensis]MDN3603141.1 hypothetical protein [Belliella kenyensis]
MKKIFVLPLLLLSNFLFAQQIEGSWRMTHQNGKKIDNKEVVKIYQDGYFSFGSKDSDSNKFLGAGGGEYSLRDNYYTETYDFYTENEEVIGSKVEFSLDIVDSKLVISTEKGGSAHVEIWEKISDSKDDLTRNWVITGRKTDENISRSTPGARRTIKILSGGRFQWVAFNSETKQFSGTGGGTYSAENGKYVEKIEFFSRDDSRVGTSLSFDFEVIDGEWHHSGMSSAGNPIYEIWTKYSDGYKKPAN